MKKNAKRIFIPLFGIIMAMSAIFASFGSIAFAVDLEEEVSVEHVLTFGEDATSTSDYASLKGWENNYGADGYVVMSGGSSSFYSDLYDDNDGETEITESGMKNNNNATSSTTGENSPISSWGGTFQQWGTYSTSNNGYRNVSLSKPGTTDATYARYSTHSVNNRWDVSVYFTVKDATPVYLTLYVYDAERKVTGDAPMEILVYNSAVGGSRDERTPGIVTDVGTLNNVYGGSVDSEPLAKTFASSVRNFVTFKLEGAGTYQFVVARSVDIVNNEEVAKGTPQPCIGGFFFDYDMELPKETTFTSSDVMTGTDWEGTYGEDGYIIFGVKDTSTTDKKYATSAPIAYTKNIYDTDGLVNFDTNTTKTSASSTGAYDFKITDDYEMTNALVSRFGAQYNAWSWATWMEPGNSDYASNASNSISGQLKLPSGIGEDNDYVRGRMQPAGNNPTGVGSIAFTLTEDAFNGKDEIYVSIYHNAVADGLINVGNISFDSYIYRIYKSQTTNGLPAGEVAHGTASRYGNGSIYMTYCIQEAGDYTIYMDYASYPDGTLRGTAQAIFFDYDAPNVPKLEVTEFTYELDGGTNVFANPTSLAENNGEITLISPTKLGYTFGGWFPNDSFNDVERVTKVSFDSSVEEKTLYAKWTQNPLRTITYEYILDGVKIDDEFSGTNTNPQEYREGVPVDLANASLDYYVFEGWYTDEECTVENKVTSITEAFKGNKTLYAKFIAEIFEITYMYVVDGDIESEFVATNNNPNTYTRAVGIASFTDATKDGYTFGGWFTDSDCTISISKIAVGVSGNQTLFGMFTENVALIESNISYVFIVDGTAVNDFEVSNTNPTKYTEGVGLASLSTLSKDGYTFGGWFTDSNCTVAFTGITTSDTGDKTFYAKFTVSVPAEFDVVYICVVDGSIDNDFEVSNTNPTKYTEGVGLASLSTLSKDGYTFGGWFTDSDCTVAFTGITTSDTGNKTLYAKFTKIENNTSSSNDGCSGYVSMEMSCLGFALIVLAMAFILVKKQKNTRV